MIIDGHAHAAGEFGSAKKILAVIDKLNVDKIILCPAGDVPDDKIIKPKLKKPIFFITNPNILFLSNKFLVRSHKGSIANRDLGNQKIFSLVKELPERIIQFYWVNFNDKDFYEKMSSAYEIWHFQGIKLHQCVVPFTNDSTEMNKLIHFAEKKKLPIFIHIYSSKEANKLILVARKFPKVNFIFAHLMGLENAIKNGSDLKNLYFDISTYYIISEKRILKAIKYFGSNHILLGSDTPFGYDNLHNNLIKIQKMKLPKEDKERILGKNIANLLSL